MLKFCLGLVFLALASPRLNAQTMELNTPTGNLFGTLLLPSPMPAARPPVALIIAGSGPTDRDGNSPLLPGANNSLRYLAQDLAKEGIATLRIDKRGVGQSAPAGPSEADLRFGTYVDDAVLWIQLLKKDKRFSSVFIIGHSEGSLIGMMAARRAGAAGFVSLAGVARPAGQIILDQLRPQLPEELMHEAEAIVASLSRGRQVVSVPEQLSSLFRPSVQPYLISWFAIDPVKELKKLSVPILIVQGTTDIQVPVAQAQLLARANRRARLLVIPGMNHILKAVPAVRDQQLKSYGDPTLPVVAQLVKAITGFLLQGAPGSATGSGPGPR
jgi:pimeloyl-ACP methyl ester carboxylesterase